MNIFCIDTSSSILSLALKTEETVFSFEADSGGRHSERLWEALEALFKTAGVSPAELDMAVCLRGPGSFTGLRIGFAAVQGIAQAGRARAASIPTLDCIAAPFCIRAGWEETSVIPAIDSKRKQFYTAIYKNGRRVTDYMDAKPQDIAAQVGGGRVLVTGQDAALLYEALCLYMPNTALTLDAHYSQGQARNMLLFIEKTCALSAGWDGEIAAPVYIRKSDAEEKCQT